MKHKKLYTGAAIVAVCLGFCKLIDAVTPEPITLNLPGPPKPRLYAAPQYRLVLYNDGLKLVPIQQQPNGGPGLPYPCGACPPGKKQPPPPPPPPDPCEHILCGPV